MKKPVFKGSCTAMITPFTEKGIDFKRMGELLDFQETNGTSAVLIAGTTGESATLEIHEYNELVDFCIKYVSGRMKTIVGIGGNCTVACLDRAHIAEASGADAVLMSTPYYNKTTQKGLAEHFTYVADRCSLPIILYNVPSRTSMSIEYETYVQLAEHPNINGVKEASGNFSLISRISAACSGKLNMWSGNDDNTLPMMSMGAHGVISVVSNIIPDVVSMLCRLCELGSFKAAFELYSRYSRLFSSLFIEVNPIPVKAAMRLMGLDSGRLRLPLTDISPASLSLLASSLDELGIIEHSI